MAYLLDLGLRYYFPDPSNSGLGCVLLEQRSLGPNGDMAHRVWCPYTDYQLDFGMCCWRNYVFDWTVNRAWRTILVARGVRCRRCETSYLQ